MNWSQVGLRILQKQHDHTAYHDQVKKDGDECKIKNLSRKRKRTVKEEDIETLEL